MKDSTELDSQGLKNSEVTKDNYTLTVVFFIIDWKGDDWRFLNNLNERHDFKKEWGWKWKEYFHLLKPGSIHAILMKSYPKKAGRSGQDFYPVAHVAEFDSLHTARLMNKKYLDLYTKSIQHATAKTGKLFTLKWCHQLRDWMEHVKACHTFLAEQSVEIFDETFSAEEIELAYKASQFNPNFNSIIDNIDGTIFEDLKYFLKDDAYLNEENEVVWMKNPSTDPQIKIAHTENSI